MNSYRLLAECIRSGQVPERDIIDIMERDPAFARWYARNAMGKYRETFEDIREILAEARAAFDAGNKAAFDECADKIDALLQELADEPNDDDLEEQP